MKKLFENVHRRLSSSSSGTNAFSIRRLSMTSNISLGGLSTLQIKVLRGGYNIDLEKVDSKFTKLHKAVYLNNEDKVRQYLSMQTMKYDVNSVDSANRTALHYAAVNGNGNIVTMLINHGAKVNIQDSDGRTPMIKAIECGHTNVLQLLMQSGADIDLADREHGNTALHHALISSELDCALYIIRNALEIDYNKRNHRKETFLHLAVKIVDLYPVIEELIANGIEIDAIDELGRSAAQVAQLHLNDEAYRIIMKYSIPNNVKRFDSNDSSLSFDYENNEEIMMLTTTATTATTATTTNTTTINDGKTETVEVHKVQDCSNHQLLSIIEEGSSSAKNSASSSNESNGKLIKHESINVIEDDTIYENCRVMDHEEEEEQELEQEQEEEEVVEVNEQFQSKSIDDEIDEMSSILNNMSSLDQMLQEGMNTDLIVQSTMKPMDEETRLAAIAINSNNLSKKEKRSSRSDWLELIGNSDSSSSLSSPINNSKTIVKTINHEMTTNNCQTIAQQPTMTTSTPIPVTPTKPTKTFAQVVASPPSRHTIIPSSPTKVNSNNSNNNHHQRNVNNKNKSNGNNWKQGKNGRSSSSSFSSSPDHSGGPGSPIKSCTVSPGDTLLSFMDNMNNNDQNHSTTKPNNRMRKPLTRDQASQIDPINDYSVHYMSLIQSIERLLSSNRTAISPTTPSTPPTATTINNGSMNENDVSMKEMQLLRRLSSLIYDSNHNLIELDYKRKEVHLLKQTIDTMQKQIENDQNYCRQLEEKITSMGKQQNQMDRRMGVNHNHQRLSIIDIDNDNVNKDFEVNGNRIELTSESSMSMMADATSSSPAINSTSTSRLIQIDDTKSMEVHLRNELIQQFKDEVADLKHLSNVDNCDTDEGEEDAINNADAGHKKRHSSLKQSDESENGKQQWQNSDITPNYDHGNKTHQQGSLKHREDQQQHQQHQQRRQHSSASNTPRMKRSNKLGMVHNGKRHRQRSRSNLQSDYSSSFSYKSKYFQHKINELRMKLGINNATTFR
ncbi:hypothetical protein RDWZM_009897 [Blomia tropicalis]|uniref:Uncharacterized protein n=1 Tax=Blomia tropicalis TaxID=40697 RepID=A0A9Q0LZX2_BLOTA|nr:hypothetical protein RDWZM_009897 [Blomia tropicalis]